MVVFSSFSDLKALPIIPTIIMNIRKKARNMPISDPNKDAKKFLILKSFMQYYEKRPCILCQLLSQHQFSNNLRANQCVKVFYNTG